jgi:hypothetical protein
VVADPGRLAGQRAGEGAAPLLFLAGCAPGRELVHQLLARRQPQRVAGDRELHAGLFYLPEQQEEHAAAEIGQHVGDQGLRRGPALGVGQHPVADAGKVVDHPLRGDPRWPGGGLLLEGRHRLLQAGRVVLDQQRHPAHPDLVEHLQQGLLDLAPADQQALAGPQVLDAQLVAVEQQAGVALRHPGVGEADVALLLAADQQLAAVNGETADSVGGVGYEAKHGGEVSQSAQFR